MNVSPTSFYQHAIAVNPATLAAQAITNGNMNELVLLINQGQVDASTRIENNETLLMFSVRHAHLDAFQQLFTTLLPGRLGEQHLRDDDGNTVFHYVALHLDDADFAPTDIPAPWQECLFALQEGDHLDNGWEEANNDGDSPIDLAGDHKDQMVDFMMSFQPDL